MCADRRRLRGAVAAVALLATACSSRATPTTPAAAIAAQPLAPASADCADACVKALDGAKHALGRFRDAAATVAAGYRPQGDCQSDEQGAIGIRYEHEGPVPPGDPAALWYVPDGVGRLQRRLAAADWSVAGPGRFGESPRADEGGIVRAWLWSPNPRGLVARSNPTEACTDAEAARRADVEQDDCDELVGMVPIPAAAARARLPRGLHALVDEDGKAELAVRNASCRTVTIGGRAATDVRVAQVAIVLEAPDDTGDQRANWYLLSVATTDPGLRGLLADEYRDTALSPSLMPGPAQAVPAARATGAGAYPVPGPDGFAIDARAGTPGPAIPITVHFWVADRSGRLVEMAGYSTMHPGPLHGQLRPTRHGVAAALVGDRPVPLSPRSSANTLDRSFGLFRTRGMP